jgi:hypothetical protein
LLDGYQTSFNSKQYIKYLDAAGHVHEQPYSDNGSRQGNALTEFTGQAGVFRFVNATTGQHFSITLEPPPGASFSSRSAEWIMEAPDGNQPTSFLPKFTSVQFAPAICCGVNTIGDPVNGDTWNIRRCGQTLTSVTLAHDAVTIDYIGP